LSWFTADLDTYGGNSGSPVFNARTHEVDGILVRGEMDFEFHSGCQKSKRCGKNDCRGEEVTHIEPVIRRLSSTPR